MLQWTKCNRKEDSTGTDFEDKVKQERGQHRSDFEERIEIYLESNEKPPAILGS